MPAITSRPPKKRTPAIPSVGRKSSPGRKFASTDAWRIVSCRTASARPWKRVRTSASRPNACTISIPTTASSVASVRLPFRSCTRREIGKRRCAKYQASTAIAGMAATEISVRRAFTTTRTITAATIIRALWMPWMTPQPMK